MNKKISIVLPCHNEEKNLQELIPEIIENIPRIFGYEIICVDDGSTDNTLYIIKSLSKSNKNVKGISFYKRSGHQAALIAGIKNTDGDVIITMDSDFQHPPEIIPKLISLWQKGYDLVQAQKDEDADTSLILKVQRKIGYYLWSIVSDRTLIPGVSDFRLISKEISQRLSSLKEQEIFIRGLSMLFSKNPTTIKYHVGKRRFGGSKYTLNMFINMFITGFISFSIKPLRFAWITGLIIFFLTGTYIAFDIITSLLQNRPIIEGWKSFVVLLLILNSALLFYLGILGEYISVIFKEVKGRPNYSVNEYINFK